MRYSLPTFVITFMALASPAIACDMHGGNGGMFNQLGGATWRHYSPQDSADALIQEEQLTAWEARKAARDAAAKARKPSFSSASSRAAMAAQARITQRAGADKTPTSDKTTAGVTSDETARE